MIREKIIRNVSEFCNENKRDIINAVGNIAYLFEHMCYQENPEKEFCVRVEELKYTPYIGQFLLESVAAWSRRYWYEQQELFWRMEVMIEAEKDEYVRFIDWLYYESIRFSLENKFLGDLTEHISCVFPKEAKEEVITEMKRTINVQEIKRNKRLAIDMMKLHYKCNDERIAIIEKILINAKSNYIPEFLKRVRIDDVMIFMLICNAECKERIFKSLDKEQLDEIEKFQGDAFYLRRDRIAECLDYMMKCIR